jgi:hypothetical protein
MDRKKHSRPIRNVVFVVVLAIGAGIGSAIATASGQREGRIRPVYRPKMPKHSRRFPSHFKPFGCPIFRSISAGWARFSLITPSSYAAASTAKL